jgi:YVTN family beta-propeller protein
MGQSRLRICQRSRHATPILVAALSSIAALLSAAVGGATATAAPAAGYTASFIPTGQSPFAVALDAATDTAYFANSYTDEITVVDTSTNAVTATIGLAGQLALPGGIAVDQVTDTIYVSEDSGSGPAVAVIDGSTKSVTATILLPGGSAIAGGVAVDSSTDTIYVSEQVGVAVIDGSTNSVTTTVSTDNDQPFALAMDETTDVIWVAGADNNDVLAISGTSNSVIKTIAVGSATGGVVSVAVDPITDTVYAGILNDEVAVINGATGSISTTITTASTPDSIAADPDSGTVFVSDNLGPGGPWGTTWVIDESRNAIVDTIDRGGWQIAVNAASGSVYEAPLSEKSAGIPVTLGGFVLAPAAANAMSPMFTGALSPLTVGTVGSSTIHGSALPAATYSEIGALPTGVTFSSSGAFSGTPAAGTVGTYLITVTASNGVAPDFTLAVTLTVGQAPTINSADQATFTAGVAGSFSVTATGYPAPTFTETGVLPPEVSLSAAGVLSGTPGAGTGGSYPITITASNAAGSVTQHFTLTVDQPYAVQASQQSGFCLDNAGGRSADGNPIQIWSCLGNANQGWLYVPSPNGVVGDYQLENSNGSCLDDPGDSAVSGTKVQLWSCMGDASQTWTQVTVGSYTEYVNPNGLCLDNTGDALADGNRVQVWACNGDVAQQWYGPSAQSSTIPPVYEVRASQDSGFCLDNAGGRSADGNPIQVWSCVGNANQGWKYAPSASGEAGDYQLQNSNGLCLDDPGDSAVNGTKVQLWSCLGDASQTWTQVTAGSYVEYVNANGLCLDNTGDALTDGNRVQVWACNGDAAQQWYGPSAKSNT